MNVCVSVDQLQYGDPVKAENLSAFLGDCQAPGHADSVLPAIADFWFRTVQSNGKPTRADFKPEALVQVLPDLFIIDLLDSGDMRYRLVGTRLAENYPEDPTTRLVGTMVPVWGDEIVRPLAQAIQRHQQPIVFLASPPSDISDYPLMAAIGTPLFDADGNVNMILGGAIVSSLAEISARRPEQLAIHKLLP